MLNGDYAVNFVQGMQEGEDPRYLKVGATCKHAFGYSLEGGDAAHPDGRVDRHHFDAVVAPQDAADTYLPPFERCVREGKAASLMCAYDSWNGVPSCANKALMTDLARKRWNFTGAWVSDCGAINDVFVNHNFTKTPVQAVKAVMDAGLDLNCGNFLQDNLGDALASGAVSVTAVKSSLRRLYMLRMRLGEFDDPSNQPYRDVRKYGLRQLHHPEIALDAARQAVVLLKNTKVGSLPGRAESRELLPMPGNGMLKLAVLGPHAGDNRLLKGNYAGNSQPSDNLVEALRRDALEVEYIRGAANDSMAWRGLCGDSDISPVAAVASAAVKRADAVVATIGTDGSHLSGNPYPAAGNTSFECWSGNCMESEGCDRTSILLPKIQRSLLATVLDAAKAKGTPVVLVVFSGGAVDLSFAKDAAGVSAILWAGFPGPAGATAISETLFGRNSPSGRLTQTFYSEGFSHEVAMTDMGMRPGKHSSGRGYRFYTGRAIVYPFGHGMHYTDFELSDCAATDTGVSVVVRNVGSVTSPVALLVFLVPPTPASSGGAPKRFLAAYKKLHLSSHEVQKVSLTYYDNALHLAQPNGTKELVPGKWTAEFSAGGTAQAHTAKFVVRHHTAPQVADL